MLVITTGQLHQVTAFENHGMLATNLHGYYYILPSIVHCIHCNLKHIAHIAYLTSLCFKEHV